MPLFPADVWLRCIIPRLDSDAERVAVLSSCKDLYVLRARIVFTPLYSRVLKIRASGNDPRFDIEQRASLYRSYVAEIAVHAHVPRNLLTEATRGVRLAMAKGSQWVSMYKAAMVYASEISEDVLARELANPVQLA